MQVSMRKSALKAFTRPGRGLDSLWDVPRWDGAGYSRRAGHACKKDQKSFQKPWQRNPRPDIIISHDDQIEVFEIRPVDFE